MSLKCRICFIHIPETEIYGDWYYCDNCKKSIPITLDREMYEKRQTELRKKSLEVIAENIFDED